MSALFFGPADRQLFGYYHAPRGASAGAVVICPSWGPEYQYAHRALRVTAKRLAERGFHVLRFDYSGVGDSWGESTDGHPDRWQEDVALAIDELQAMSDQRRIDLVGLRVGAAIVAAASVARSDVRRIVLWDPILDGSAWTRRFKQSAVARRHASAGEPTMEFAQRLVSPDLVRRLSEIGPADYCGIRADAVLLLRTQTDEHEMASCLSHVDDLQHAFVEDAPPWLEDTSIWSGLVPAKAVRAIVDWLGQ